MSPVDTWRDFVYCNNMLGNELMRQDNREIGIRNQEKEHEHMQYNSFESYQDRIININY